MIVFTDVVDEIISDGTVKFKLVVKAVEIVGITVLRGSKTIALIDKKKL